MRYTAVAIILGALYLVFLKYLVFGILLILLSIFILTAQYVTIIDAGKKKLIDAFVFYGIRIVTEKSSFAILHKIVITKGKYSQNINTRAMSRQLDWTDYTGTLIYDDTGSLDLLTREDKKELMDALRVYAGALHVGIEDHSIQSSSRSSYPS